MHALLRPGGHLHLLCFLATASPATGAPAGSPQWICARPFGSGWRIESLAPDRFDINPGLGTPTAEAWLADIAGWRPVSGGHP